MSTFDDASLVFIPSGYKTSKAYSVKPSDGSGDMSFSRSNDTATRVASNGLIERVRTNLILQSQTFDNASWTKDGATVTANSTTAPDGTTTADKVLETATTAAHNIYQIPTLSSNIYSISFFVKKAERFKVAIADRNSGGYVAFNLNTGAIIESLLFSGKIQSLANDWYRVTITSASALSTLNPQVFILPDSYTTGVPALITYAGSATSGLFVWGAQLETGDIATDYIATTSAAVSVGPVANVPRLDYLNSSCPRLLLEPQRTNSQINSENFAAWLGIDNVTIGSNTTDTLDPAGYNGADKITIGSGAPKRIYEFTGSSAGTGTISLFVKAGTSPNIALFTSSSSLYVQFNISTQVITPITGTGTITSYGNGWYRITATATLGSNEVLQILFDNAPSQTIYIWGAQVEAGAYATSYIPTLGAAVTRGADVCSKTSISSLIGQTEGTLYADVQLNNIGQAADRGIVSVGVNGAGYTSAVYISFYGNDIYLACFVAGSPQIASVSKTITTAGRYKIAAGYKDNDFVLYVNGQLAGSDNSGSLPSSMSVFTIDGINQGFNGYHTYNESMVFASRLTNAQLAELTTI